MLCQAYQQLCDWWHGMGSAALSMWASFFGKETAASIAKEANQLLDWHRYLTGVPSLPQTLTNYWNSTGIFTQTWTTATQEKHSSPVSSCICWPQPMYLPHIEKWIHVPLLYCSMLYCTGFKGILELCGAVVCVLSCYLTMMSCYTPCVIWYLSGVMLKFLASG